MTKSRKAKVTITGMVAGRGSKVRFPRDAQREIPRSITSLRGKALAMRRIGEIIDEIDLKGKNDELVKELVTLSTKHGILTPYTSSLTKRAGEAACRRASAP